MHSSTGVLLTPCSFVWLLALGSPLVIMTCLETGSLLDNCAGYEFHLVEYVLTQTRK